MFVIKKYSSSGTWTGEPVKAFDTSREAHDWLAEKSDKAAQRGYDISREYFLGNVCRLDLAHDDMADAWTYVVEFEADEQRGAS